MRLRPVVFLGVLCLLVLPASAHASELIDRNAENVQLRVNAKGEALLSYEKAGETKNVLVWGAVNAIPPSKTTRQVEFQIDYTGGWGKYKDAAYWKRFTNVCRPYSGPQLDWFVTACTAPDGTHWAVQSWQRVLPNYGVKPTAERAVWELRLSHFDGVLPKLEVHLNWAYKQFDHIFGSFTYKGWPVHGFASTAKGEPLDSHGRNVYVDTFNSAYGVGWWRDNGFLTHVGTGKFCYGFYKHGRFPSGMGERYRATVIGPGVAPDVTWEGAPLGQYSQPRDLAIHEQQKAYFADDTLCKPV
jgi:hypothetical protein